MKTTMLKSIGLALAMGGSLAIGSVANAAVLWKWSFANETGTFTTSGTAAGGVAAPGSYTLSDFSVTASQAGGTIGSLSGGQYVTCGYATDQPYSFDWNGNAVTQWNQSGANTFNWWVFDDVANLQDAYFFGWQTGNNNVASQAAFYDDLAYPPLSQPSYAVTVSVAAASAAEPGTLGMMLTGLLFAGWTVARRTRRN